MVHAVQLAFQQSVLLFVFGGGLGQKGVQLLRGDLGGPMMELLSPMAVMLEGLGFNLCVAPFLNICVLNLTRRVGTEDVGGGWSWVRGVVLELDRKGLRSDSSEDES